MGNGESEAEFVLPNGSHSYKFIEELGDGTQLWNCDPEAEMYRVMQDKHFGMNAQSDSVL